MTVYLTRRRLLNAVTMFLVAGASLALLVYVAYGQALKTYQQFVVDKLAAQVTVVQTAVQKHLLRDFALEQYSGFTATAGRVLESDPSIVSIVARAGDGEVVFSAGVHTHPLLPPAVSPVHATANSFEVRQDGTVIQVILPLRSRTMEVGSLVATMARTAVTDKVQDAFRYLPLLVGLLAFAFATAIFLLAPKLGQGRGFWLHAAFPLTFLLMATVVISMMIVLYADGAQAKTRALAFSLSNRLSDLVAFNVDMRDIRGLDRTVAEYQQVNPEISAAALTVNGVVQLHSDPKLIGRCWIGRKDSYRYLVDLTPKDADDRIEVAVEVPKGIVIEHIARCVKNFLALFVASAFIASIFLQLAQSIHDRRDQSRRSARPRLTGVEEAALNMIKPIFFGAIFVEHLNYAFLPQVVETIVSTSGLSSALLSVPFTAYWLSFALILLPAGHLAEQTHPRPLIYGGLAVAGLGLLILHLEPGISLFTLARALSGIGQGVLFIGVQSYVLLAAPRGKKTQGASIIVLGYQGGMISGMAIGSLLVGSIQPDGVFLVGTLIALALAAYAFAMLPVIGTPRRTTESFATSLRVLFGSMRRVGRDADFLATMLLIGIPAKAVLTGVVTFAMPLLLTARYFPQEDIGQIIMVYAAAVIVASAVISKRVDRTGDTTRVLFAGAILGGIGMLLVGLFGFGDFTLGSRHDAAVVLEVPALFATSKALALSEATIATVIALLVGVTVIGVAHGFVNAPVITHVADSPLALEIGQSQATATYRFLERVGHIAGPIVVGNLLYLANQSPVVIAWLGGATILFGLVFVFVSTSRLLVPSGERV
jgi:predicted MFS family arabinose efflux permease